MPNFPIQEGKAAASEFVREITCWMKDAFDRGSPYASPAGQPSLVTGKYMWLLRRVGQQWQITRMLVCVDEDAETHEADS